MTTTNRSTEKANRHRYNDGRLLLLIAVLTAAAWWVGRQGWVASASRLGYWVGVTGACMMVLLLLYPLRKRLTFMQRLGKTRYWFEFHMLLGILGPLLILVHANFRFGSLNAAVALFSMILVASSGVAGRFIYARIHHGLHGEKASLAGLAAQLKDETRLAAVQLKRVPAIEEALLKFQQQHLKPAGGLLAGSLRAAIMPVLVWLEFNRQASQLKTALRQLAKSEGWSSAQYNQYKREAGAFIHDYLHAVLRVSTFSVYDRLFSLWHVLHVPLVYGLVLTGIAHVVAVHLY